MAFTLNTPTLDRAYCTLSRPSRTPIDAPALDTHAYAFNSCVYTLDDPHSHAQARCLAFSGLDTCGATQHASRCRACGTVGRGRRCSVWGGDADTACEDGVQVQRAARRGSAEAGPGALLGLDRVMLSVLSILSLS